MITNELKQFDKKQNRKEYDCTYCTNMNCVHRNSIRRLPRYEGGLGLCVNLKENK